MPGSNLHLSVPRIFISGVSSDCGAEQLTTTLCSLLKDKGLSVSVAICGTHFNFAKLLSDQLGRFVPCLEPRLQTFEQMLVDLYTSGLGSQIQIICSLDGFFNSPVLGSFDNSPAELAIRTGSPTILCLDPAGIGNGLIPQIKGFKSFATGLTLASISVLDSKHFPKLENLTAQNKTYKELVADYFPDLPVINLPVELVESLPLPSGVDDQYESSKIIRTAKLELAKAIYPQIDLSSLITIANQAPSIPLSNFQASPQRSTCRIAVAIDSAFNLLYQNNLILLRYLGAELIPFAPLMERLPANVSGIYLPGLQLLDYWKDITQLSIFYSSLKDFLVKGGSLYVEGTSFTLFTKVVSGQTTAVHLFSDHPLEDNLEVSALGVKTYFSDSTLLQDSLLGEKGTPIGLCLQNNLRSPHQKLRSSAFKLESNSSAIASILYSFSKDSKFFATNAYLNFSSNAIVPYNFINSCISSS